MKKSHKKIISTFLVALMMLTMVGTAVAQPMWTARGANTNGINVNQVDREMTNDVNKERLIRPVHSAGGFALHGDEYHIVKIHVVGMRRIKPIIARDLLKENLSIENISEQVDNNAKCYYIGRIRFGEEFYMLRVIEADKDHLIADILTIPPKSSDTEDRCPEVVGNISIDVFEYEGSRICEGSINMHDTEYRALMGLLWPKKVVL